MNTSNRSLTLLLIAVSSGAFFAASLMGMEAAVSTQQSEVPELTNAQESVKMYLESAIDGSTKNEQLKNNFAAVLKKLTEAVDMQNQQVEILTTGLNSVTIIKNKSFLNERIKAVQEGMTQYHNKDRFLRQAAISVVPYLNLTKKQNEMIGAKRLKNLASEIGQGLKAASDTLMAEFKEKTLPDMDLFESFLQLVNHKQAKKARDFSNYVKEVVRLYEEAYNNAQTPEEKHLVQEHVTNHLKERVAAATLDQNPSSTVWSGFAFELEVILNHGQKLKELFGSWDANVEIKHCEIDLVAETALIEIKSKGPRDEKVDQFERQILDTAQRQKSFWVLIVKEKMTENNELVITSLTDSLRAVSSCRGTKKVVGLCVTPDELEQLDKDEIEQLANLEAPFYMNAQAIKDTIAAAQARANAPECEEELDEPSQQNSCSETSESEGSYCSEEERSEVCEEEETPQVEATGSESGEESSCYSSAYEEESCSSESEEEVKEVNQANAVPPVQPQEKLTGTEGKQEEASTPITSAAPKPKQLSVKANNFVATSEQVQQPATASTPPAKPANGQTQNPSAYQPQQPVYYAPLSYEAWFAHHGQQLAESWNYYYAQTCGEAYYYTRQSTELQTNPAFCSWVYQQYTQALQPQPYNPYGSQYYYQ